MQLESTVDEFRAQGLGVAAISYDTPEILAHFAERLGGFSYPLLSDPDSAIIRAFGVLNRNIPENDPWHGAARPGTFIVDADGIVTSKYFEPGHRQRVATQTMLVREFGVGGGARTQVETPHLKLTAYPAQDVARRGNRVTLVMEVDLPEKMHLYAPGVEGYRPVRVMIPDTPYVRVHPRAFPASELLTLPVIKETVPVFHGSVRILQDVTLAPRYPRTEDRGPVEVSIPATFSYQACDDRICYEPAQVDLTFNLRLLEHDRTRVPEELRRQGRAPGNP